MDATNRKPEGCPSSRTSSRAFVAMLLATGLGGCAVLSGESGGPATGKDPAGFGRAPEPSGIPLRVAELQGNASVTRGGRTVALKRGNTVTVGEPIQVAKGGLLRLNLADQGLLELGSGARLVAHRLPSAALLGGRETSLRLESGYLRVVWSEPVGFRSWPLDISMSRWSASLKPGEYFFESGEDDAIACSTTGEVRLKGTAETLPDTPGTCVALEASKPARTLDTSEKKWATVRANASLKSLATAGEIAPPVNTAASSSASKTPAKAGSTSKKASPTPETVNMVVASTTGSATVRRRGGEVALRKGATVAAGQPVQVGPKSRVSLSMPERGWVDLGPSTRLVLHKLPETSSQGSQETWMRLERGTVRVAVTGTSSTIPSPELSFSRWAAKLGDGEYFFESSAEGATACAAKGDIKLSGVPETLPQAMNQPCVRLRASKPPVLVTPSETAWASIRKGASIETALAQTVPTIAAAQPTPSTPAPQVPPPAPPAAPPAPPPVATETMPDTPRSVGMSAPPAEISMTPIPVFQAPPPPEPETAYVSPIGTTEFEAAAPSSTLAQQVPSQADAPAAPTSDGTTMVAMAEPPAGPAAPEWLVNVDAFSDPTRAQQLLDVLTEAGYGAALRTQLAQGVPSYRVVITGLSTESEADNIVSELEQRYELTSAWVLRTR